MQKKGIHTDDAPQAIGPYQQAIQVGPWLYSSGQIALDPKTGEMHNGEIEMETERTLNNVGAILKEAGMTFDNVVKANVYLSDMGDFARMNGVYETFFSSSKPARACVQVAALPKGAKVEIDVVAFGE